VILEEAVGVLESRFAHPSELVLDACADVVGDPPIADRTSE
jgi:hypothetical protein